MSQSTGFPNLTLYAATPMITGTITEYNPENGHGYVRPDGNDDPIPFEADEGMKLQKGDRIEFEIEGGMAGEMAFDVRPAKRTTRGRS